MNFQISGYRTALTSIHFITKSGAASLPQKAQDVNDFEAASFCLMRELECNRVLLTMALISGADVSMPAFELQEDSFNIHRDINMQKYY